MKWLDTHCHVCSIEPDGTPRGDFGRHLLDVLDRDPADLQMVVCPDTPWFSRIMRSAEGMRAAAEEIRNIVTLAPGRLHGAFMPNPHLADESMRLMDRCFGDWGFVMLGEMMQYSMNFRLVDPKCLRVLRHAAELGAPIMSHVATLDVKQGGMTGTGQLLDLLEAAVLVPDARIILGHFVGMAERDPTWVEQYLSVIDRRFGCWPRNLWAEIRDFGSPGLLPALERIPLDRLVSGTDWTTRGTPPFSPFGCLFDCKMNGVPEPYDQPSDTRLLCCFLKKAGLNDRQIQAIAYDNAAALLGLSNTDAVGNTTPTAAESARPCNPADLDWEPDQACSVAVMHVPPDMTADDLVSRFTLWGLPAVGAERALDYHTGRPWGYAVVRFADAQTAQRAIALTPEQDKDLGVRPVYLTHRASASWPAPGISSIRRT
jgi:predicted TIM-barrel fold metal-dependent hydrolase